MLIVKMCSMLAMLKTDITFAYITKDDRGGKRKE